MSNRPLSKNPNLIPKSAKLAFKGNLFDVYQWQQEMFDGSFQTFEMLRRPDSTLVIGIEGDQLILLDEEQPGSIIQSNHLPGGRLEEGEDALEGAKREMEEETGLRFEDWALLEVVQPAIKIEWFVYVYVAVNKTEEVATAHEVGEKIVIKRASFGDFKKTQDARFLGELQGIESIDELLEKVNLT